MNKLSPTVKDRLILMGWFAGLLLAASLVWSLTFPYRAHLLMKSVNKALDVAGDTRLLVSSLPAKYTKTAFSGPLPMGFMYKLYGSDSVFFVFVIMNEGILVPCGVEISKEGKTVDIVPLGSHARQVLGRIPSGVIQVYLRRIESAAANPPPGRGAE